MNRIGTLAHELIRLALAIRDSYRSTNSVRRALSQDLGGSTSINSLWMVGESKPIIRSTNPRASVSVVAVIQDTHLVMDILNSERLPVGALLFDLAMHGRLFLSARDQENDVLACITPDSEDFAEALLERPSYARQKRTRPVIYTPLKTTHERRFYDQVYAANPLADLMFCDASVKTIMAALTHDPALTTYCVVEASAIELNAVATFLEHISRETPCEPAPGVVTLSTANECVPSADPPRAAFVPVLARDMPEALHDTMPYMSVFSTRHGEMLKLLEWL